MDKKTGAAFAAAIAGLGIPASMNPMLGRRYEEQDERRAIKAAYPLTGTGKRQGERLARQKLNYAASDKCIARIRERLARAAP